MKIKVKRYCVICHTQLQKGDKYKNGKQKGYCETCNKFLLRRRPDVSAKNTQKTFTNGITNSNTKTTLKLRNYKDHKRFKCCGDNIPPIETYPGHKQAVVVIDGIRLRTGTKDDERVCLIAIENNEVIAYKGVKYESSENGDKLLRLLNITYAIVCDGQKGMLSTIRRRFPNIGIQRCLVHIYRNVVSKISRNPETEPGQYLFSLVQSLMNIKNEHDKYRGINAFEVIYEKYHDFINEGSRGVNAKGKAIKGRKHKQLRSAFKQIENEIASDTLFVYLINPNVPKTTNDIEGGINKQIRKLLGNHCGLVYQKQRKLVEAYLNKRSKKY